MNPIPSVYFFTLHKCASTLFAGYVLKNLTGLEHVNYARTLFSSPDSLDISFQPVGHVYGPLRVSNVESGLLWRRLVQPCLDPAFLADKKAVCFIRDPRDILISYYYSEGWSHALSVVPEIRKSQQLRREMAQSMTVDEYACQEAPAMRVYLERLLGVMASGQSVALLHYEDMILRQEAFARQIKAALPIADAVVQQMFERSKPRETENPAVHRRSGQVAQYRQAFSRQTQEFLAECFGDCLTRLGYAEA